MLLGASLWKCLDALCLDTGTRAYWYVPDTSTLGKSKILDRFSTGTNAGDPSPFYGRAIFARIRVLRYNKAQTLLGDRFSLRDDKQLLAKRLYTLFKDEQALLMHLDSLVYLDSLVR